MSFEFAPEQKQGVYQAIYQRRDMRHFLPTAIDEELLYTLLQAAHAAPSVGMMQPWRIIRVSDKHLRQSLHALAEQERVNTAHALGEREDEFMRLKVEGILDCGEVLVMGLMDKREQHIFGRRTLPEMDLASLSCAIQNLWLAARAEGLGLGWVSLFDPAAVADLLGMPADSKPVAILCLGYVDAFYEEPMLQQENWVKPGALDDVLMDNRWDAAKAQRAHQREG